MYKPGDLVEIKEFIGLPLPGTNDLKHNGCFRVDDDPLFMNPYSDDEPFEVFIGSMEFNSLIRTNLNQKGRLWGSSKVKNCILGNYPIQKPKAVTVKEKLHHHHHN